MSALIGNLQERIIVCDADGAVVFSNRSQRTGGTEPPTSAELIQQLELRDLQTEETIPLEQRPIMRALREETVRELPVRFRRDGDEWRFGIASAQPIADESGARIGAMAVVRDVTDARRADAAISELEPA